MNFVRISRWIFPQFCLISVTIEEEPAASVGIIRDDRGLIEGEYYE